MFISRSKIREQQRLVQSRIKVLETLQHDLVWRNLLLTTKVEQNRSVVARHVKSVEELTRALKWSEAVEVSLRVQLAESLVKTLASEARVAEPESINAHLINTLRTDTAHHLSIKELEDEVAEVGGDSDSAVKLDQLNRIIDWQSEIERLRTGAERADAHIKELEAELVEQSSLNDSEMLWAIQNKDGSFRPFSESEVRFLNESWQWKMFRLRVIEVETP